MNSVNKIIFLLLIIGVIVLAGYVYILLQASSKTENVIANKEIWWSNQWKLNNNNETEKSTSFPGSEFRFAFENSKSIAFKISTENLDDETELNIRIDDKEYKITNPHISNKRLTIVFEEDEVEKRHTVRAVYYCSGMRNSCKVAIKEILLEEGEIVPVEVPTQKTIAVLGDSISLIYGKNNYTVKLADRLQYRLHNASFWGGTVSRDHGIGPAINRYKDQIVKYNPDYVLIFLGENDVIVKADRQAFQRDLMNLFKGLQVELPDATIIAVGILAGQNRTIDYDRIQEFNTILAETASANNIQFLDAYDWLQTEEYGDQIHPNISGQTVIAEEIYQALTSIEE